MKQSKGKECPKCGFIIEGYVKEPKKYRENSLLRDKQKKRIRL